MSVGDNVVTRASSSTARRSCADAWRHARPLVDGKRVRYVSEAQSGDGAATVLFLTVKIVRSLADVVVSFHVQRSLEPAAGGLLHSDSYRGHPPAKDVVVYFEAAARVCALPAMATYVEPLPSAQCFTTDGASHCAVFASICGVLPRDHARAARAQEVTAAARCALTCRYRKSSRGAHVCAETTRGAHPRRVPLARPRPLAASAPRRSSSRTGCCTSTCLSRLS